MARKIRIPLNMPNGSKARTIEELRENFDLNTVLGYYADGTLTEWLEMRYYDVEVSKIKELNSKNAGFPFELCNVLGVELAVSDENAEFDEEYLNRRSKKLSMIKQITDDADMINNVDSVAFNQEDLLDALDLGKKSIYLVQGDFTVPLSVADITYIGIDNPSVVIRAVDNVNFKEKNIEFRNCYYGWDVSGVTPKDKLYYAEMLIKNVEKEEPKKPKSVSFMDRVRSFFGNKAAREKVNTYNSDLAKYKADKALWDSSLKNCKTPEDVTKQINANRLAKNKQLKKDTHVVCDTYRRIEQDINGYVPEPEEEVNPLETTLSQIHAKYKDFDVNNVKDIKQLKDIYKDTLTLTNTIMDSSVRNTNLGKMYKEEGAKLFSIIGDNRDTFKGIENANKSSVELRDIQNYKVEIGKNVKYIEQSSTVKNKVKDNVVTNDVVKKADEIPNLGDDNKAPQMGGMGGF